MVNTKALKILMIEKEVGIAGIAEAIGRSYSTASMKINGKRDMTFSEAEKIQALLGIHDEDFAYYFMSHERSA